VNGTLDVVWVVPTAARHNRMPIASAAVLGVAGLALLVALGGLGVREAARAVPGVARASGEAAVLRPHAATAVTDR
jgi:hypothetical protein